MDNKQAIKILEEQRDYDIFTRTEYRQQVHDALDCGIKALQAQADGEYITQSAGDEIRQKNYDLISRQAVLESIKNLYPNMPVMDIFGARLKWLEKYAPYLECENAVEHLPSITLQERTGHWIKITKGALREKYICSECGRQIEDSGIEGLLFIKYPHCLCGARMVEPQESEG